MDSGPSWEKRMNKLWDFTSMQAIPRVGDHPFVHCRYSKIAWGMMKEWTGLPSVHTSTWTPELSIKEWWTGMSNRTVPICKDMASITMLVCWTIWNKPCCRLSFLLLWRGTKTFLIKGFQKIECCNFRGVIPLLNFFYFSCAKTYFSF
jgi:hypothetical protein